MNRRGRKTLSVPLIVGGVGLLAAMGVCCGVGGYFAFVHRGGGALGGGHHFTLTEARVEPTDVTGASGGDSKPEVRVVFERHLMADVRAEYYVVVQSHYARSAPGRDVKLVVGAGSPGRFSGRITGGGMPESPYDVWIERRGGGGSAVVSNVVTVER